jgi:hypothetical protein
MNFDELINAECRAEAKIRSILLDLQNETGHRLDYVKVDTRNFAVEVSLEFPVAVAPSLAQAEAPNASE